MAVKNYGTAVSPADVRRVGQTYQGAPRAIRRAAAEDRIEDGKGDLAAVVRDAAGRPLEGAAVSVRMVEHAFGFGSAVAGDLINNTTDPNGALPQDHPGELQQGRAGERPEVALAEQPQRGHQRHQLALRQRRGRRPRPQPDLARLAVDAGLAGQHVRRAELPLRPQQARQPGGVRGPRRRRRPGRRQDLAPQPNPDAHHAGGVPPVGPRPAERLGRHQRAVLRARRAGHPRQRRDGRLVQRREGRRPRGPAVHQRLPEPGRRATPRQLLQHHPLAPRPRRPSRGSASRATSAPARPEWT